MHFAIRCALHAAAFLAFTVSAPAQESHVGKITGHASAGNDSFTRNCAGCHSASGNGKGSFAPYLDPHPRDLTAGIFKCRSTPSGTLPTDQDLYNTMIRGIVASAMPSWAPLTPQARVDMVAYIKKFHPEFATLGAGTPIVIPPEPGITLASITRGAALYQKLACAQCHGSQGQGDGPDAASLRNYKHEPIPPYDFTVTTRFKCSSTNAELYDTYMTGMDGTPMPSYAGKVQPEDAWDLVYYTRTLQTLRKSKENSVLKAAGGPKILATVPSVP
jgi:cytochrome c